jgi:hypothetical protein
MFLIHLLLQRDLMLPKLVQLLVIFHCLVILLFTYYLVALSEVSLFSLTKFVLSWDTPKLSNRQYVFSTFVSKLVSKWTSNALVEVKQKLLLIAIQNFVS